MTPHTNLFGIGLAAGLKYAIPTLIGALLGFIGIFVLAFTSSNPVISYTLGIGIGIIVGATRAFRHLRLNNVPNYLLICMLSTLFGIVLPVLGGLIAFPILTSVLGKSH